MNSNVVSSASHAIGKKKPYSSISAPKSKFSISNRQLSILSNLSNKPPPMGSQPSGENGHSTECDFGPHKGESHHSDGVVQFETKGSMEVHFSPHSN